MTFNRAIDLFLTDMRSSGRITSPRTEVRYRSTLDRHAEDVTNRDPRTTNREDAKRTLRRWEHPNTQRTSRAVLVSFYDWCMEEGIRKDNPARQTRRPKRRQTNVYRLTREEVAAMLSTAQPGRERRVIYLGICAGLRRDELRHLQGRHFQRPGFIWVSRDIGKGGRERWIPVIADLVDVVSEIRASVAADEFVLCAQRWRNPPVNTERAELAHRPCSPQALWNLVINVAKRAGIRAHVTPHSMRHAFGDHIARHVDLLAAQAMLGHANVDTTREYYVGDRTLDELAAAIAGFTWDRTRVPPPAGTPDSSLEAPTRIELVEAPSWAVEPHLTEGLAEVLGRVAALYRPLVERAFPEPVA